MKRDPATKRLISGFALLLAIGGLVLPLYPPRPAVPFDFLTGAVCIPPKSRGPFAPSPAIRDHGAYYTFFRAHYSLPADFDTLNNTAQRELREKGFHLDGASRSGERIRYWYERRMAPPSPNHESILITRDIRYLRSHRKGGNYVVPENQPGWVGVDLMLYTRQSPLEISVNRCKQWIAHQTRQITVGLARR